MASLQVKAGGVFRTPIQVWVKAGGVWRNCVSVWVKSGGVWRQTFASGIVAAFTRWQVSADNLAGSLASAALNFNSDGTVTGSASPTNNTVNGSSNWYSPTTTAIGSTFWIRATVTSGTVTSGTTGSWLQLSSNRGWTKSASTLNASVTLTLEIATDSGGSNIVFTSTNNTVAYTHS